MGRRAEIALGVLASVLLHLGLVLVAPLPARDEPLSPRKRPPKALPVEVRREKAKLLADEQKKADEVVADLVKAEPPKPVPTPEPPKAAPKKQPPKKKEPPKPAEPPRETPRPDLPPAPAGATPGAKPAPFVLSNVSLSGGVAVQTGSESNLFGDPTVDARGWKKKAPDAPTGPVGDGAAPAPERRVVVVPPKPLNDVKGRYPDELRDENRIVRVELLLKVDATGTVADARVLKGDKPPFDAESKRTAAQLRFSPATRDGAPIPYELKWTVVFIPESG
jgi:TonB family protein